MTIEYACNELQNLRKRTDDKYIISRLDCIIEDLTDFMNSPSVKEEFELSKSISEQIDQMRSRSVGTSLNHSWVNTLYFSTLKMFGVEQSTQAEYSTIQKLNNISESQEVALNKCNSVLEDCIEYQTKKASKKYLLFKFGVLVLICVAIVFTVLSLFKPFEDWGAIVGALIGAADFCFGLVFQIYERKDDMAQKSKTQAARSDLQVKREQINAEKQTIDVSVVNNETHGDNSPIVRGDNNKFNY